MLGPHGLEKANKLWTETIRHGMLSHYLGLKYSIKPCIALHWSIPFR